MAEDIAFAPNYTNILEIDITPTGTEHTWAWVGPGISNIVPDGNEETDEDFYWDGFGMKTTDVKGGQMTLAVEGHRLVGDPAQDYVQSLALSYGQARKTTARLTDATGDVIEGKATLTGIIPGSSIGDANSKGDFSFGIAFDGRPSYTPGNATTLPESVTAQAVAVQVGATVAASATIAPTTAGGKLLYAIEDTSVATVDMDGKVTGVKAGDTRLTVRCAAKPSVTVQVDVTVSA